MKEFFALLGIALAAALVLFCGAWFVLLVIASGTTQAECLSLGYRSSDVAYTLTRYCINRVDQTDITLPLAEARKHPRGQ